ncbi:hypothetical protein J4450_05445 [Candidatus Micrarchaeota archaeon]|nr:hypothetical protein [Candidatus Micrarchaeota archaeon]
MSELTVLSWIISLTKMGMFAALFAFSIVLARVSQLKEIKFFIFATLCFMLSSIFELMNSISYLDQSFEVVDKDSAMLLAKLFLMIAGIFLFLFLYKVNKNTKQYL